jgi:uncharacterized RDD family membrane protein YckC
LNLTLRGRGIFAARRLGAAILDYGLVLIVIFVISAQLVPLLGAAVRAGADPWIFITVGNYLSWLSFGLLVLYGVLFERSAPASTLGKLIFGIEVRGLDGTPPGLQRTAVRNIAKVALFVALSFVSRWLAESLAFFGGLDLVLTAAIAWIYLCLRLGETDSTVHDSCGECRVVARQTTVRSDLAL